MTTSKQITISPELRELFEKDYGKMLADLEVADAVINRDGIIFEWALRCIAERETLAERRGEQTERQFILNILDGVDLADEALRNEGGGTKAIRLALQSRVLTPDNKQEI